MPELPEVETTVRGISPYLVGNRFTNLTVRDSRLRWPVPDNLASLIVGKRINEVCRRAKYILVKVGNGHVLIHLGMSGSLRFSNYHEQPKSHDHVEFQINDNRLLRFHDPRRFGCVLWVEGNPYHYRLLAHLGIEPLDDTFNGEYLYAATRNRSVSIKNLLMNSKIVVGIGNIYASEALHRSGINPVRRANQVSEKRYQILADSVKKTMENAISAGGTTLNDYVNGTGSPGYFGQELLVYGREGKPCKKCGAPIKRRVIGQRSTFYCRKCQT